MDPKTNGMILVQNCRRLLSFYLVIHGLLDVAANCDHVNIFVQHVLNSENTFV